MVDFPFLVTVYYIAISIYFYSVSLQVLLLVANSIDSNVGCTRLVVDGWLEIVISDSVAALKVLSSSLMLRKNWDSLLQAKLSPSGLRSAVVLGISHHELEKVTEGLVRFLLYTEVLCLWCWMHVGYFCF